MSESAQVRSIDAIDSFQAALVRFEQRAKDALETLTSEVRRADDWLRSDRPPYWKEQVRLASEDVHQAKVDLNRCLMYPVAEERTSCREERDRLKQAQARLDYCGEKTELVRQWRRELSHELYEFEGRLSVLREMLEGEMPQARGRLKQIVRQLDNYKIEKPPEVGRQPSSELAKNDGESQASESE